MENQDQNKPAKADKKAWWQPAMVIFGQITGWIAAPIIIALFVGRWLDEKYNSEPWLYLASMMVAFIITSFGIALVSVRYIKKIEQEAKNNKKEENNK